MTRQRIEVKPGIFYTVNADDPFPIGMRLWAIIQTRLVDDSSGEPVLTPLTIHFDPPNLPLRTIIATDGWLALAGRPLDLFPSLAIQGYSVHFTIYAAGYQALAQTALMPVTPGFPNSFQPLKLGDVHLIPV